MLVQRKKFSGLLVLLPLYGSGCLLLSWPEPGADAGSSAGSVETGSVGSVWLDPQTPTTGDDIAVHVVPGDGAESPEIVQVRWLLGDLEIEAYRGAHVLPSEATARGDTWRARVTLRDRDIEGIAQADVTVRNSVPSVESLTLAPESPRVTDLVAAIAEVVDLDDDPVSISWTWTVDGVEVPEATGAYLSGEWFTKGQEIRVLATPTDGIDEGSPFLSEAVHAVNSPPLLRSITLEPSNPRSIDTIAALVDAWDPDGDEVHLEFEWSVGSAVVQHGSSHVLGPVFYERGRSVIVGVTPSDGEDDGELVTSDSVTWTNSPPTAPEVALSPEVVREGESLLCEVVVPSTDLDGDPVSYEFTWLVDGVDLGPGSLSSDGMATSIAGSEVGPFEDWRCEVRATDGHDFSEMSVVSQESRLSLRPRLAAVATQGLTTHVISATGDLWSWGQSGAVGDGTPSMRETPVKISGSTLPRFVSVARTGDSSVALAHDGTLWTWGDERLIGRESSGSNHLRPRRVHDLSDIVEIDAGWGGHSLALRSDGSVYVWGWVANGLLGSGSDSTTIQGRPARVPIDAHIVQISAGATFALALDDSGQVWAWGLRDRYQLGDGVETGVSEAPSTVDLPRQVVEIFAGTRGAWVVDSAGDVKAWGWNQGGLLPVDDADEVLDEPRTVPLSFLLSQAELKAGFAVLCSGEGQVYTFGASTDGHLGHGLIWGHSTPRRITSLSRVQTVSASWGVFALDEDFALWAWGDGLLGRGREEREFEPVYIGQFLETFLPSD